MLIIINLKTITTSHSQFHAFCLSPAPIFLNVPREIKLVSIAICRVLDASSFSLDSPKVSSQDARSTQRDLSSFSSLLFKATAS